MKTLLNVLTSDLAYDGSWAVYAERIDGEFRPESAARIGQRQFENGGILDGCEFFASNEHILDFVASYLEERIPETISGTDREENESALNFVSSYPEGRDPETITAADRREAAEELITVINEQAAAQAV
jgi:hypothetical protein